MKRLHPLTLLLLLCGGLVLTACTPHEADDGDDRLRVTATIGMVADAATVIGGDQIRVEGLMGPGIDPHLYKATAGDVRALAEADLILFNGLHLEAAMGEVLEEIGQRRPSIAVSEVIPEEMRLSPPEFQGNYDPHVWFDVARWKLTVAEVTRALSEEAPELADTFRANDEAYQAELEELDNWVREQVATIPEERRVLITAHDAFNYFGSAYGLEVKALQGISTATEAGTADVQELVAFIVERQIPAIFVESSVPPRTIEAVQAAVRSKGFEVTIGGSLFSDAMGDAGTVEGTYLGMVRHNVRTIVDALVGAGAEDQPDE